MAIAQLVISGNFSFSTCGSPPCPIPTDYSAAIVFLAVIFVV